MSRLDDILKAVAVSSPPKPNRKEYPFVGTINFQGIPIDVEQRKGDTRKGVDKDGHEWSIKMHAHYGEVRATKRLPGGKGADGDRLDVYVGSDDKSPHVFVIHQNDPVTKKYDEDKVLLGFGSKDEALALYRAQYDRPGFYGGCATMSIDDFKAKLKDPDQAGSRIDKALASLLKSGVESLSDHERDVVGRIRGSLDDSLRRKPYKGASNPMAGHCYVASEAAHHALGPDWRPHFIRHEDHPHWFLKHRDGRVLDITQEQFATKVPHEHGVGKGFLTSAPSKRAQEVMRRAGVGPFSDMNKGAGVETPEDEALWSEAKAEVDKQHGGHTDKWALVQHVYQSMKGKKKTVNKAMAPSEKTGHAEIEGFSGTHYEGSDGEHHALPHGHGFVVTGIHVPEEHRGRGHAQSAYMHAMRQHGRTYHAFPVSEDANRAHQALARKGLATIHEAHGPDGEWFRVMTPTAHSAHRSRIGTTKLDKALKRLSGSPSVPMPSVTPSASGAVSGPAATAPHATQVMHDSAGTPHAWHDGVLHAHDGNAWHPVAERPPGLPGPTPARPIHPEADWHKKYGFQKPPSGWDGRFAESLHPEAYHSEGSVKAAQRIAKMRELRRQDRIPEKALHALASFAITSKGVSSKKQEEHWGGVHDWLNAEPRQQTRRSLTNAVRPLGLQNQRADEVMHAKAASVALRDAMRRHGDDGKALRREIVDSKIFKGIGPAKTSFMLELLGYDTGCLDGRVMQHLTGLPPKHADALAKHVGGKHDLYEDFEQRLRELPTHHPKDPDGMRTGLSQWRAWDAHGHLGERSDTSHHVLWNTLADVLGEKSMKLKKAVDLDEHDAGKLLHASYERHGPNRAAEGWLEAVLGDEDDDQTVKKAHDPEHAMAARFLTQSKLRELINRTHTLAMKTQRFHWNVDGPDFPQLHRMFSHQYDELADAVDELAERYKAIGPGEIRAVELPSFGEDGLTSQQMCAALATDHETCHMCCDALAKRAESAGDSGTVDLAGRRAAAHQKAAWMLRATAKPQEQEQPKVHMIGVSIKPIEDAKKALKRVGAMAAKYGAKGDRK